MLRAAVLTISDSRSRGEAEDTTGPRVCDALRRTLDADVAEARIIPDERSSIVAALRELVAREVPLIVTAGGTGCAPRDVTPEATREVIEREVPGLAEAMRIDGMKVTPFAVLSRGVAGIAGRSLVINLPGSEKGAVESLLAVIRVIPHALKLIAGESGHP